MLELQPGIFQLKNQYVNLYLLVEPAQISLIDTGIKKSGAKLVLASIQKLGRHTIDLKHILITHADPDHTGSVAELKAITGATIFAHSLDGKAMGEGRPGRPPKGFLAPLINLMIGSSIPPQTPDRTLAEGQSLPIMGGLEVIETPGHTPGHVAFYNPSRRILFAGDALMSMRGKLSFIQSPFTWDFEVGKTSVQKLSRLGATTVCCGHGPALQGASLKFPF
jgi:glyoxylase-like metal-dependent hydrolase (beta-lactamase superfamily II)